MPTQISMVITINIDTVIKNCIVKVPNYEYSKIGAFEGFLSVVYFFKYSLL